MNIFKNRMLRARRLAVYNTEGEGGGGGGEAAAAPAAAPADPAPGGGGTENVSVSESIQTVSATSQTPIGDSNVEPATAPADESWKEGLGELAKNQTIGNVKSLEDLANMAIQGEKTIGELRTQLKGEAPAADASAEDVGKFFNRYAPENPEGYGLDKKPEGLPDGVDFNPESAKEWSGIFHKLGLHPAQGRAIQNEYAKLAMADANAKQEAIAGVTDSYKQAWGGQFEARLDAASKLIETTMGPEQIKQFEAMPAEFRSMFGFFADSFSQKYVKQDGITTPTSDTSNAAGGNSRAELQQQMNNLQGDPAYFDPSVDRVKHAELQKKVQALSAQMAKIDSGA